MMLKSFITALVKGAAGGRRVKRAGVALQEAESLLERGDAVRAKARYVEALELDPLLALAHVRLGFLCMVERRYDDALRYLRAAHDLRPLEGGALQGFVQALLERGELPEANRVAEEAALTHPESCESWFSLALARQRAHRYPDALASYDKAVALGQSDAELYTNRAIALQNLGRLQDAYADYERALAMHPGYALARFHRSLARLSSGEYASGWPEYETRLASADLPVRPRRYPRWDGADPAGLTVLVYGEQGLGDEIMFASCVPDLLHAGARCVIECQPGLQRLFARSFPQATVYAAEPDKRVPDEIDALGIDAEVPLGSLPLHYRHALAAFPQHRGYLRADPRRVAFWRARVDALGPGLKVGISWRGGTHASRTALRSIALEEWLPVLKVPGLRFVSLQYGADASAGSAALWREHGVALVHWPEAIADYDETAALVTALDLTISVCTSVVHLAGALGRPVWVLAPRNAEWRYGNAGTTMPWYPSARAFRQQCEGDWKEPIAAVQDGVQHRSTLGSRIDEDDAVADIGAPRVIPGATHE